MQNTVVRCPKRAAAERSLEEAWRLAEHGEEERSLALCRRAEELLAQNNVAGLFSDTTERALVKPLLLSPRGIVTDGAANAQEERAARSNRLNVYQLLHIFEGSPKCKATTASNCK